MGPVVLNEDVLAIICEFLTDVSDILSCTLTCSSLRPVANRRLLSSVTANLKDSNSVLKFHSFLFADAQTRTPHVRALKLNLDLDNWQRPSRVPQTSGDFSLLINTISLCLRLKHIEVLFGDWYSDVDNSLVIKTIADIPSLRSLSVHGLTRGALTLLREVRAPLRRLSIYCHIPGDYWHHAMLETTLNLTRLASTLEELELAYFIVDRDEIQKLLDISTPSVFDVPQYPAVRSLSIRYLMREPRLDHLQHLFPALDGTLSLGKLDTWIPRNSYARIRAANQRAQLDAPFRAWRKLDRVWMEDARMLYVLGLRCPIRLIIFEYPKRHTRFYYAREALCENPVPRLKLSLAVSPQIRKLDELLSPELARMLTHLMVCFVYSNGDDLLLGGEAEAFARLQWNDLLGEIVSALRSLHNLTHLRIVVHATVHHGAPWTIPHSEDFVDAIRGDAFDFEETAAALARLLPSLQFLALTTSGYLARRVPEPNWKESWRAYEQWHVGNAWRMEAQPEMEGVQDGGPVVVTLHSEVAETIMRKEELVLSEADETSLHLRDR